MSHFHKPFLVQMGAYTCCNCWFNAPTILTVLCLRYLTGKLSGLDKASMGLGDHERSLPSLLA